MLRELFGAPKSKAPAGVKPISQQLHIDSILGTETHFEGNLQTEGSVRIHGTFTGDISAKGKVSIGDQAKLEGNLVGESVDVAGLVKGDVTARKVAVMRTGRIHGNLRLEKLMTEEGGFIQGLVTMEEHVELPAQPAAAKEEAPSAQVESSEKEPEKVPVKARK